MVILDKTMKDTSLINAAIPNSQDIHSTIIMKLQKYTDLKEELTRIRKLKTAYTLPLALSTRGIIRNKSHERLKLFNLRFGL
jgi:hypothetical protein